MSEASPDKVKKPKTPKKQAEHPKYIEMIEAACVALKERSGSSRQAIGKYICSTYKVGDNIGSHLKRALKKGVTDGKLVQKKGTGASGSFKVAENKSKKASAKPKKAAAKPKKAAAKKVKKTPSKKTPKKKAAKSSPKKAAKKLAVKKAPVKKAPAKKVAAKKAPAKKAAAKKPAAKKAVKSKKVKK